MLDVTTMMRLINKNEWFCTDDDCMQYCKPINNKEYKFIQAVWLDTCEDDEKSVNGIDEFDNYTVCAGYIDLAYYSKEEIENVICGGYDSVESVKEIYGEDANQIIAKLFFEKECLYDSCRVCNVVSWADAEKIIHNYMEEN